MAKTKPGTIQLGGLELILLVVIVIIILKMFILTGCPCGCDASSAMWCCGAKNARSTVGTVGTVGTNDREVASDNSSEQAPTAPEDKPTIYYHYTEWCGYCKKMKPVWDNVKSQMSDRVFFIENDEDQNRTPNVNSYPTVVAHVDGQKITYNSGYTEAELLKFVQDAVEMKNKGQ